MKYDIDQINRLIEERRSIFPPSYTGELIPDAIISQILENANWAPTHKMTEPWRFIVYKGSGLIKLGEIQAEHYKRTTMKDGSFTTKKYENLLVKPSEASHVIVIGMQRDQEQRLRELEEISAVACAVQNMYLTATAYGLGCYWGTGGITYMDGAQTIFGWDETVRLMGFFFLGIPKAGTEEVGKRTPVENKVRWVTIS